MGSLRRINPGASIYVGVKAAAIARVMRGADVIDLQRHGLSP
jgi:hypothetical protein